MKHLTVAVLSLLLLSSCASSSTESTSAPASTTTAPPAADPTAFVTQLASNPLIASLVSSLGLTATQAVGGAGALLGLAQAKLPKSDWSAIEGGVPGAKDLVQASSTMGGMMTQPGSLQDLSGAFAKMGLSSDQVTQLVPALTDYVGKATSAATAAALADVLK